MEQKELREFESRCIQEEPPWCVAACPIHVDARTFVRQMRDGDWEGARKTLNKTMPFPGILGRICDHPCQTACKRGEVGDPIAVGALERACVAATVSRPKTPPMPKKQKQVAVLGAGLSSLTVAWDLARKGYPVTLFTSEAGLGGRLRDLPEATLPREVLEKETAALQSLGVRVNWGEPPMDRDGFQKIRQTFDAVYVGCDSRDGAGPLGLKLDGDGRIKLSNVKLRATSEEGVFAGGFAGENGPSFIQEVAEGRWAATSIDRYLQNVSLQAGREKEGPYATRLYTSIEGVEPAAAVPSAHPEQGYTREEAELEAQRCLRCQCLECVKICPYLERFGSYPRKYAREIYNNESIVMGEHKANLLMNTCSLCRLCEEVCPENFSMADLCRGSRERMVQRGKMPPSAHDFALRDMRFSNGEKAALTRNEPGHEGSGHLFFPGCQLSASAPGHVERTYAHLRDRLSGGVGLMLRCCGAPADWAARRDLLDEDIEVIRKQWEDLGRPRIIAGCSTCYGTFKEHLPEADLVSLWEALDKVGLPETQGTALSGLEAPAVHDPCTARHEPSVRESVRRLLTRLGCGIRELPLSGELTECCGYGGLMANANPSMAREVAERRGRESASPYVAYCAMCRDSLAGAGKKVVHLLDMVWGGPEEGDPLERRAPGYSRRRENRAGLKNRLLRDVWNERPVEMEEYEKIPLRIAPEVQERMEERRILREDVQQVIHHAETTGNKLYHSHTGHYLAHHRPVQVTYWVEYSPLEDGYAVHNAYCHRMEILEGEGDQ